MGMIELNLIPIHPIIEKATKIDKRGESNEEVIKINLNKK